MTDLDIKTIFPIKDKMKDEKINPEVIVQIEVTVSLYFSDDNVVLGKIKGSQQPLIKDRIELL